ncbi:MAG: MYXO-CTERM sorting domain-containing protein [Myxococcales bacterium]
MTCSSGTCQAGICKPAAPTSQGCGCGATTGPSAEWLGLMALLLAVPRRRV